MRLKKPAIITVRVSYFLKHQITTWAARAGMSNSDFVRMALVHGARQQAKQLDLFRESDNVEVWDVSEHHWIGS